MKPNTRILDYVTLVQDGIMTVDDAPQDIKAEVTKWVRQNSKKSDMDSTENNRDYIVEQNKRLNAENKELHKENDKLRKELSENEAKH